MRMMIHDMLCMHVVYAVVYMCTPSPAQNHPVSSCMHIACPSALAPTYKPYRNQNTNIQIDRQTNRHPKTIKQMDNETSNQQTHLHVPSPMGDTVSGPMLRQSRGRTLPVVPPAPAFPPLRNKSRRLWVVMVVRRGRETGWRVVVHGVDGGCACLWIMIWVLQRVC